MPLSPGSSVGHYQILGSLGAGGMGEVYRARDTKLGRDVALKILPEDVRSDGERRARFAREARSLAALNHPNIAQVHGFEDGAPISALIMELVEGEDLAERIRRGVIPYDEAIAIARQIGEALQAAHDRGIIHRDLKPANIKLRDDGAVKVLDFGLAKALDPALIDPSAANLSHSPTVTSPAMTMRGEILGTAAYMSPEQAKGRVVDKKADIWAFGCVLYEMLTGRKAFAGDDVSDTLASILKSDVNWSGVPVQATRLLKKCLEKDPRRRLHDIGDAWDLLEAVTPPSSGARRWQWVPWSLAALFAISTIGMTSMRLMTLPAVPTSMARLQLLAPPKHGFGTYVALSHDGRRIVFSAADSDRNVSLWARDLDSVEPRRLAGTEGGTSPFWSPDGRFVAFGDGRVLKKIDVSGGPPQKIADLPTAAGVGAWSRDGVIVIGTRGIGPIYRVSANGGTPVPLTALDVAAKERGHSFPMFLPDQKRFLYLKLTGVPETQGVYVGDIDRPPSEQQTQRVFPLTFGPLALVASPTGARLLFMRDTTLMSQPFDPGRVQLSGDAHAIAERIATAGSFAFFGAGGDVVLYRTGATATITNEQLTWYSRTGTVIGKIGEPMAVTGGPASLAIAPDGRRAVVMVTSPQITADLWMVEFARGLVSRLTFSDGGEVGPVWAPDSGRLVYRSSATANASFSLMVKDIDGTTEAALGGQRVAGIANDWSRDGRFVLFTRGPDAATLDLHVFSIERQVEAPLLQTPFSEGSARFSPNNRWVAYESNESGQPEIYVRPFVVGADGKPSVGAKWRVSLNGGRTPRWRGDGREIIYQSVTGDFMAADVSVAGNDLETSVPRRLFSNVAGVHAWDVTADAQRLLLSVPTATAAGGGTDSVSVILHWTNALAKN
jgi:serine/threonine protein kinase/Tol biopolymer transport system component